MTIERCGHADNQRLRIWAMAAELTDNGDGTYTLPPDIAAEAGTGSEVIIIDTGQLAIYDSESGLAYVWGGGGS